MRDSKELHSEIMDKMATILNSVHINNWYIDGWDEDEIITIHSNALGIKMVYDTTTYNVKIYQNNILIVNCKINEKLHTVLHNNIIEYRLASLNDFMHIAE